MRPGGTNPLDSRGLRRCSQAPYPYDAYPPPGKHDGDIKKIDDFLNLVMEQDCRICEVNQKGLHSNRFEHGVLVPQEYEVRNFQQWVLRELGEC